jgi:hypothetical protein
MSFNHMTRRIGVATVAALSAVVLAAPAQAGSPVRPDDQTIHGPGAVGTGTPAAPLRPDDRADRKLPNADVEGGVIRGDDKQNVRFGVLYEPIPVVSTSDGFDWGDAGIGALAAFGLALLAAGASVAGRRHRRAAALS